jgi:hypothetical protein
MEQPTRAVDNTCGTPWSCSHKIELPVPIHRGGGTPIANSVVAEVTWFQTLPVTDELNVLYLPCRLAPKGSDQLMLGQTSGISLTSTTVGSKTCIIVPYIEGTKPEKSLTGPCVCLKCLRTVVYRLEDERTPDLKELWEKVIAPVALTTYITL